MFPIVIARSPPQEDDEAISLNCNPYQKRRGMARHAPTSPGCHAGGREAEASGAGWPFLSGHCEAFFSVIATRRDDEAISWDYKPYDSPFGKKGDTGGFSPCHSRESERFCRHPACKSGLKSRGRQKPTARRPTAATATAVFPARPQAPALSAATARRR
jgi:hypothetical protein